MKIMLQYYKILQIMAYMNNFSNTLPVKAYKKLPTNNRVHLQFQFYVIFTNKNLHISPLKYPFPQIILMYIFSMLLIQVHILICTQKTVCCN